MLFVFLHFLSKWVVVGQNGFLHKSRERQAGMQTHQSLSLFPLHFSFRVFLSHAQYIQWLCCVLVRLCTQHPVAERGGN